MRMQHAQCAAQIVDVIIGALLPREQRIKIVSAVVKELAAAKAHAQHCDYIEPAILSLQSYDGLLFSELGRHGFDIHELPGNLTCGSGGFNLLGSM